VTVLDKLMSIFEGLNLSGLKDKIPSAESLVSGLTGWSVFLVLLGPLLMLGLGIFYMFFAPKEANHVLGYRFFYAKSRVSVWQFAQRLAGMVYAGVGGILFIVMLIISLRFGRLAAPDMVWLAAKCVMWQVALALIATLAVNVVIVVLFDFKGNPRKNGGSYAKPQSSPKRTGR
jgi:hypothetical protein